MKTISSSLLISSSLTDNKLKMKTDIYSISKEFHSYYDFERKLLKSLKIFKGIRKYFFSNKWVFRPHGFKIYL